MVTPHPRGYGQPTFHWRQKQNPAALDGDALDRHRERMRAGMGGYWHACLHRPAGSFLITVRDPTLICSLQHRLLVVNTRLSG
jgi:hypothetical protein